MGRSDWPHSGLARNMTAVSRMLIHTVLPSMYGGESFVLVESSHDRLIALAGLADSCLLSPSLYPSVRYFVPAGGEIACRTELLELFDALKAYPDMRCIVNLSVEPPLPNLTSVLLMMRTKPKLISTIVLSSERAPQELVRRLQKGLPQAALDPVSVMGLVSGVPTAHWFPLAAGQILEPLVRLSGYGSFALRPSPLCAFAAVFVNTAQMRSRSLRELVDIDRLCAAMLPLVPMLKSQSSIGLLTARKLRKAIKGATAKGVVLPDILAILLDPSKRERVRDFFQSLQVIVVHHKLDLFAVDMTRECFALGSRSSCEGCV